MHQLQTEKWVQNVAERVGAMEAGNHHGYRAPFIAMFLILTTMGISGAAIAAFIPSTTAHWAAHVSGVFPQVNVFGGATTLNGRTEVTGTTGNQDVPCGAGNPPNRCGNGDASAIATASFGRLGVADLGNVFARSGGFGDYSATSDARFDDQITPMSATLPFGTHVLGTFILSLHGDEVVSVLQPFDQGSRAVARFRGEADLNNGLHISECIETSNTAITVGCSVGHGDTTIDISMVGTFILGTTYALDGLFTGTAAGFAGSAGPFNGRPPNDTGTSSALVNAENTSNIYLQPMGDFFFVSASGHDYLRPVVNGAPEPTSLALLSVGVAGLCWSRRRRLAFPAKTFRH